MFFRIFMALNCLLIPLIMIVFGKAFIKSAPKDINPVFGYRTKRSMINRDTWEFAHKHCGKLWLRLGTALFFSIIPIFFFFGADKDTLGNVGTVIIFVQLVVLIISIFPTESALKKTFDENGNRK